MIITIDGPTASGKSTVARLLAQKLRFSFLSTGYVYRGLAYALATDYHYGRQEFMNPRADDVAQVLKSGMTYEYHAETGSHIRYKGELITDHLKSAQMDDYASLIAQHEMVRAMVHDLQRNFGCAHDTVAEGRDTGTVVFPNADAKFFLTAALPVRALRWQHDQQAKGKEFSLVQAEQMVAERDKRDTERTVAPLVCPEDAIVVDNSSLNAEDTVTKLCVLMAATTNVPTGETAG